MAHFVLIHGMFHGGWCWDRLRTVLEADGHRVTAPDLAGCGDDTTAVEDVTLSRWTHDIAAIQAGSAEPVILVGHSRGGIVISQAAEARPDKVAVLVYLTAVLLPSGGMAMHVPKVMAEEGFAPTVPALSLEMADGGTSILPPRDAGQLFYAECTSEDRRLFAARLAKEPIAPSITPLSLTDERWGSIPRIYIETMRDRTLDPAAQRAMIARTGASEVYRLDSDHMPILTHVAELAAILTNVAQRHAGKEADAA